MEVLAVVGVVDAGRIKVVVGAQVRKGRPCFLSLPLPCLELDPYPAISDLYNMCINK